MIFDISCNIADEMYAGFYNNKQNHEPDTDAILKRCIDNSVIPFFVGTDGFTSEEVCTLAKKYNTYCYVGIHPNSVKEASVWNDFEKIAGLLENQNANKLKSNFENEKNNSGIKEINNHKNEKNQLQIDEKTNDTFATPRFYSKNIARNIIALGEIGLDYYRSPDTEILQRKVLTKFLELSHETVFLHSRNSHRDIVEILSDYKKKVVVHSFDGTVDEMTELLKLGYYIGINGCSVKKEDSIECVRELDISRLLIESDAPYCSIGSSYAGHKYLEEDNLLMNINLKNQGDNEILKNDNACEMDMSKKYNFANKRVGLSNRLYTSKKYRSDCVFKGRNEPVMVVQVLVVIAGIKEMEVAELENILYKNTVDFFGSAVVDL